MEKDVDFTNVEDFENFFDADEMELEEFVKNAEGITEKDFDEIFLRTDKNLSKCLGPLPELRFFNE